MLGGDGQSTAAPGVSHRNNNTPTMQPTTLKSAVTVGAVRVEAQLFCEKTCVFVRP